MGNDIVIAVDVAKSVLEVGVSDLCLAKMGSGTRPLRGSETSPFPSGGGTRHDCECRLCESWPPPAGLARIGLQFPSRPYTPAQAAPVRAKKHALRVTSATAEVGAGGYG